MKRGVWTIAIAFAAMAWACGGDDPPSGDPAKGSGAASGSCPDENPECKEIATESAGAVAAQRRKCVDCHDSPSGKLSGRTTGIPGQQEGIELYPPNLTNDKDTGIGAWTDDQLANAIRTGLDKEGLN